MSGPVLHVVTFVDWTKYRLVIAADTAAQAIDIAQFQLETGEIWENSEPCDGTQDDWYAYPRHAAAGNGGAS